MKKKGFTLIELLVVISIIGIVTTVIVPTVFEYVKRTKITADIASLNTLNTATKMLDISDESDYLVLNNPDTSDISRMTILVDNKYLSKPLEAREPEKEFKWNTQEQKWKIESSNYVVNASNVVIGTGWFSSSILNFFGLNSKDITIPTSIDGIVVVKIYQDAARNLGLSSVNIPADSNIIEIHARAFKDNELTEIIFPESVKKIDYAAFMNNNLTKIVIGSDVSIQSKAFDPIRINNINVEDVFNRAYAEGGAGTYLLINDDWVKQ